MTLREAAERTSRSITTLRRYIRSGRLHAEKRYGRFGPEYFVSDQDLTDAGLETISRSSEQSLTTPQSPSELPTPSGQPQGHAWLREIVPLGLYQELRMKHEQLLVQYGMVRAGGLRTMELRSELETARKSLEHLRQETKRSRAKYDIDTRKLQQELRAVQLELEGKRLEVAALEEKTRALEMLSRNAVTNEALDVQLRDLSRQQERVRDLRDQVRPDEMPVDDKPDH